jgi:hypothetical protein
MKIFSEFVVLHEDGPMPSEDRFCPSFWAAEDFDSDGDYYYKEIEGRWTTLQIKKRLPGDRNSLLEVCTFRENRKYDPAVLEVADLQRYIDYWAAGRYRERAGGIQSPAVTWLRIETFLIADYREFLATVHFFLEYTKGILVSFKELNAQQFRDEFLGDEDLDDAPP